MSILTIQRWVERRSSSRAYAHLRDITTSTSFQKISGLLKSTDFASQEQTSHCYSKPVLQSESGLCWGSFAFQIVDLTFHEEWHSFRVRCQPSCSGSFAWPGSHPSLAIDKDATVEVVLATRATSVLPACVCYLAHLGPHLYSKRQLPKNHNFEASTS